MTDSCIDIKEELSLFIDGELDEQKQGVIRVHLADCASCQQQHQQFQGLRQILQGAATSAQESAPDLWASLATRLPGVCASIQHDLSAYLDGELPAAAKDGIDDHLNQCDACLNEFKALSRLTNVLSTGMQLSDSINIDIWSAVKSRLNQDCALIKGELSPFLDKEVAILRHRAITSHLTECAECKDEFAAVTETGDLLRTYYQPILADDFDLWPAIKASMNVVKLEPRQRHNAPPVVRRMYAVAAAILLGLVVSTSIYLAAQHSSSQVAPVTAEAYLIDQSLGEPANVAEAVVYEH